MSLFGGDSVRPSLSTSPSPAPQSTASIDEPADVPDAQISVQPSISLNTDEDESEYEEDSYDDDDDIELLRPNKFTGSARTWRGYTLADRQIAASLETLEASDLAAHLYNTHNLKYRVQRPAGQLAKVEDWHTKDSWLKKGEQLLFTNPFGETETELIPSKLWSAWPLPPGQIVKKDTGVRQPDNDEDAWYIEAAAVEDAAETMREEIQALFLRRAKEQWLSRELEEEYEDETAGSPKANPTESDTENGKPPKLQSAPASDVEMQDYEDNGTGGGLTKERRGRYRASQQDVPFAKPVFLADDDSAWQILGPTVNSLLSRLGHLALSIRRSRLNHTGRGAYSDMSGSEFTSDADDDTSSSSAQSLPRKTKPPLNQSRRSSDASITPGFSTQTGLMDWSEVLGIASTIGWNETAVARAAQRCAVLFNEKMSFRKFDEAATSKPVPDPVQYTPSTIPDYEALGIGTRASPKRPFFNTGTLRCPHKDCWGSEQDFKIPYRTIEHVMRVHGYDPRKNNEDNEERKCGGVHIDGFLQPITAKQGWLGSGRARSKSADKKAETAERVKRKKQKIDDGDAVDSDLDM
ncbi:hypothetical protein DM02DRAFT_587906 [Periconia macrospinosa]|uniref:Rrn9 domain-containing protein n=1 Tax=Periconia macrospinosa TaxID=97972 RepID=A0A2V1DY98_9PLEO|nr:hypothetical protein DM02DRAFT_587906 [Periconia macrospinosa]